MKPLPGSSSNALPGLRRVTLVRMAAMCSILSVSPDFDPAMNSFNSTALQQNMSGQRLTSQDASCLLFAWKHSMSFNSQQATLC